MMNSLLFHRDQSVEQAHVCSTKTRQYHRSLFGLTLSHFSRDENKSKENVHETRKIVDEKSAVINLYEVAFYALNCS